MVVVVVVVLAVVVVVVVAIVFVVHSVVRMVVDVVVECFAASVVVVSVATPAGCSTTYHPRPLLSLSIPPNSLWAARSSGKMFVLMHSQKHWCKPQ